MGNKEKKQTCKILGLGEK